MTTQAETTEFHYVTTIQTPDTALNTRDGILTVPAGYTRAQIYKHLTDQLKAEYETTIAVLFYSLEPNRL